MILVVGGRAQGKRTFAREVLGCVPSDFADTAGLPAAAGEGAREVADELVFPSHATACGPTREAGGAHAGGPTREAADAHAADSRAEGAACAARAANRPAASRAPRVAYRCEELARRCEPEEALALLAGFDVVLLESVGSGIVPVSESDRAWRERAGRLGCLLAAASDVVVRMVCGIPCVIKGSLPDCGIESAGGKALGGETVTCSHTRGGQAHGAGQVLDTELPRAEGEGVRAAGDASLGFSQARGGKAAGAGFGLLHGAGEERPCAAPGLSSSAAAEPSRASSACAPARPPLRVVLVRHGRTAGTDARRYSGAGSDEPLSATGIRALEKIGAETLVRRVFTSGMARTNETARILFPNARIEAVFGLREMDFGDFEGKSFPDLANDARYRAWVDSGCETACPMGEDKAGFTRRVVHAFRAVCKREARCGAKAAVFVVHAGTIRAILSGLARPAIGYFDIDTQPGGAWEATWEDGALKDVRPIRGASAV